MSIKGSSLIIPISIVVHLIIINGTLYLLTPDTYTQNLNALYYNFSWLLITNALDFYPTKRKETFFTNIHKMLNLYTLFGLCYFAIFGFSNTAKGSTLFHVEVLLVIFLLLTLYRIFFYWAIRRYRFHGGNFVNVLAIGRDKNLKKIRKVFDDPYLGYRYKGFFDDSPSKSPTYLGKVKDAFDYVAKNSIDEIYCMASKFSQKELQRLIDFADNNMIKLKVIPDNKEVFTRAMTLEMFDEIPVLNFRRQPLDTDYAKIVKRMFDLFFSSLVIVFVLSWLVPLMYVLIKAESPGPLFFRQKRHGYKKRVFWCYKFRSMAPNAESDSKMATKNDMRVTKIGKFIRKTSIDELPQFINVFLGDMSVVGPRPHMELHTEDYQGSVDKYLVRHFVKPGITGLAQIRGYRGEVERKSDILNRIRLDVLYIEKWTLSLDLHIIFSTMRNVFAGEAKAY
ncbi:undecaprenyl-phosphate glucose phosphotransferase [Pseudozobellia thermophila]|uniref:Putative colanic acid biosysnthesis UDP-glucose lipid carrier transferase n=1 Tax=Pseudozobellia thermophila TaxID=192903 RepID=A0A1M6KQD5_9FLAO|nr:undecaprenyl-phosphate glucose phosphotransferase [Pseudozobellia thermophila]SHJ61122.1 putative colanic acid biosysnthesis UDP-glucose lipid carrier transferase [Pseudozobellia thermophila]